MTARRHLAGYTIGADLIDQSADESAAAAQRSGETGGFPEPPPAGASGTPPADETPEPAPLHTEKDEPLEYRRDGLFQVFKSGGLEYRLGGVKPLFVTSLRVNIRAGNGKASYYDSIDLYAARSRTAFTQAAQRALGTEPARTERDLVRILEYLETERDAALLRNSREEKKEPTPA